jgi:hypothetical protein
MCDYALQAGCGDAAVHAPRRGHTTRKKQQQGPRGIRGRRTGSGDWNLDVRGNGERARRRCVAAPRTCPDTVATKAEW